jgi:hypothetical protein
VAKDGLEGLFDVLTWLTAQQGFCNRCQGIDPLSSIPLWTSRLSVANPMGSQPLVGIDIACSVEFERKVRLA